MGLDMLEQWWQDDDATSESDFDLCASLIGTEETLERMGHDKTSTDVDGQHLPTNFWTRRIELHSDTEKHWTLAVDTPKKWL